MKFKQCKRTKTMDTAHDTDIEDSIANLKVAKFKGQSKFKKNKEATIKKKRSIILQKMTELALHSVNRCLKLENNAFSLKIFKKNFAYSVLPGEGLIMAD